MGNNHAGVMVSARNSWNGLVRESVHPRQCRNAWPGMWVKLAGLSRMLVTAMILVGYTVVLRPIVA